MERISHNLETLRGFTTDKPAPCGIVRIVSDGQSGAARGALEAGLALGLNVGGWCAADHIADDGPLDAARYGLRKRFGGFGERVAANIRHSDGTMLLSFGSREQLDPRTKHAENHAKLKRKAMIHLQLPSNVLHISAKTIAGVRNWLTRIPVRTLNVVGPFERKEPGLQCAVQAFFELLLAPSEDE
jgi:hypothetical protein